MRKAIPVHGFRARTARPARAAIPIRRRLGRCRSDPPNRRRKAYHLQQAAQEDRFVRFSWDENHDGCHRASLRKGLAIKQGEMDGDTIPDHVQLRRRAWAMSITRDDFLRIRARLLSEEPKICSPWSGRSMVSYRGVHPVGLPDTSPRASRFRTRSTPPLIRSRRTEQPGFAWHHLKWGFQPAPDPRRQRTNCTSISTRAGIRALKACCRFPDYADCSSPEFSAAVRA